MLGATYVSDGSPSGNVQNLSGLTGTIVHGLSFDYMYDSGPDKYVDVISADEGDMLFESQDSNGRVVCWDGPTSNYRSINSSVIFGALRNSTSTKNELMGIYMDFLTGQLTGIENPGFELIPQVSFENPCNGLINLDLTLPFSGNVSISLYDTAGRLVGMITDEHLNEGTHHLSWNGSSGSTHEIGPGAYMILIRIGEHVITEKLLIL